jgi:FkbM family methyltransferase
MTRFVSWLSRLGWVRRLAQALGLHRIANFLLRLRPLEKRLPGSAIRYRAVSVESIPLGREMLEQGITYDRNYIKTLGPISNFADLGCNVGYFSVLLADLFSPTRFKGLMADANRGVVAEAGWHAANNPALEKVKALWGFVGCEPDKEDSEFYIYASNICSSRKPVDQDQSLTGKWQKVSVPCLQIETLWNENIGPNERCHLLKIDVEGAELDFFRYEASFLDRVDAILLEWHKWAADLKSIEQLLTKHGFHLDRIFEEDKNLGTCCFRRRK